MGLSRFKLNLSQVVCHCIQCSSVKRYADSRCLCIQVKIRVYIAVDFTRRKSGFDPFADVVDNLFVSNSFLRYYDLQVLKSDF